MNDYYQTNQKVLNKFYFTNMNDSSELYTELVVPKLRSNTEGDRGQHNDDWETRKMGQRAARRKRVMQHLMLLAGR